MKNNLFIFFTAIVVASIFCACKKDTPEEQLIKTYEYRRQAVYNQLDNLVYNIGDTYTDKDAVMKDLDEFVRKHFTVKEITLASLPLAKPPFCVNMTKVYRAAPAPIGKYIEKKKYTDSRDMYWYCLFLKKKIAFWYKPAIRKGKDVISYIRPVLDENNPLTMLYVLKIDFSRDDNPILFWNVYKEFWDQQLTKQEEKHIDQYLKYRKALEKQDQTIIFQKDMEKAEQYYKHKQKELQKATGKLDKEIRMIDPEIQKP
ncbi:MAG: hypothetical protein WC082_02815 [Victivallales bacterium]